jgi:hypothetical protein
VHALGGALAGALLVGGLSALGAALVGLGEPRKRSLKYESELKADKYIVIGHGTAAEIAQAREILHGDQAADREALAA